ncbi:MAG: DEAD/DEAH box helicase [Tepidisphaeraceae bacterium]|jgi:ATP-dependent RNA helicase DeaD
MSDKTEHPPYPEQFAALGVRPSILRALAELSFTIPSEIQKLLIPRALAGVDILGQARTGTGKTAAFTIPILQRANRDGATQAIIMVPTRELAVQVDTEIQRLSKHTPIRSVAVYGGQKIAAQLKQIRFNPQIVVGTPGRVMDLLDRGIINFRNLRFVVLDEVDRMLDIGFRDDIRNILSRVKQIARKIEASGAVVSMDPQDLASGAGSAPQAPELDTVQTVFVSATIADEIERLARTYMREPVDKLIAPGCDEKPTVAEVEQYYFSVQPWDKYRLLRMLLMKEQPPLAIIFCRTKHGAEKLARRLHADNIECREIHGNLAQNKRDRVMKGFRGGKFSVLVATDLASRGIDVAGISHIINFDLPDDPEAYIHRVGRTARMGAAGKAYTFVSKDQGELLTKVEELINMLIRPATLEGFTPSPTPSDWIESLPHGPGPGSEPAPSAGPEAPPTEPARKLTIGSKIPLSRRHKRRR